MGVIKFRQYLHEVGITQAELAKKAKVSRNTIKRGLDGKVLRFHTQRKILKALGLKWDDRSKVFGDILGEL